MNSIVQAVFEHSLAIPEKTAIIVDDKKISYRELAEKAAIFSNALKSHSVRKGQRIAIETRDLIAYFTAFLGCQLSNAIAVPIEEHISSNKLQDILKSVKPVLVFMQNDGESYRDFLTAHGPCGKITYPKGDATAAIIATTGTTGKPVLVTHTNKSILSEAQNLSAGTGITRDTILFSNVPHNLALGYRRVFAALYMGATAVLTHKPSSPELFASCIEKFHVSHLSLVYSNINMLLDIQDPALSEALHRLSTIEIIAGSIALLLIHSLCREYPHATLYNVYGATESGCILINNVSQNPVENCLGKTALNAQISIIDENGVRIETPRQYGYIAVKGSMNMSGYYHKKALTAKIMHDDYIILNDIGYFDEDGFYYFVSRVGEIINAGEHKVIPGDIERVVSGYEGIADCACAILTTKDSIQVPILYIVCSADDFAMEELKDYLAQHLESYKLPAKIICLDKIPRTATGKILRKSLAISEKKSGSLLK